MAQKREQAEVFIEARANRTNPPIISATFGVSDSLTEIAAL
jgi:hypothetical protein